MSSSRPFVISPSLSAVAIAFTNPAQSLIADLVLPRTPVGTERFKWMEYPLAEGFTVPDTKVGRRGRVAQVEFTSIERDGSVDDHGLEDSIPETDIKSAKAMRDQGLSTYDPENHAAQGLTNLIVLSREVRVASLVQNPANYSNSSVFTLAAGSRFSDYGNSDPFAKLTEALESTFVFRPNTITMGQAVWTKLRSHPKLIKAVKGGLTEDGAISREQFKELLEIQNLYIGSSYVNMANKGQTANIQRTWGKNISLTYIDPVSRPEGGVTFGYTAQFGGRIAGRRMDSDVGLLGGVTIRVGEQVREMIVAKDVGALIQNAIA